MKINKILFFALFLGCFYPFSAVSQVQTFPYQNPNVQFFDNLGVVCSGCTLSTFSAGTTTPLATYSDAAGTVLNSNPITLDSAGRATIYLTSASYKFVLKNALGVTLVTQDNITAANLASTLTSLTVNGTVQVIPSTAATSGANQSGPLSEFCGNIWNGSASVADCWKLQDVVGTGSNPTSTLTLTHSGSSGATAIDFGSNPLTAGAGTLASLNTSGNVNVGNSSGTPTAGATNLFNPIMNQGGLVDNGYQGSNIFASKYTTGPANPVTNVFALDALLWAASGGANSLSTGKTTYSAIVSNEYAQTQGQHLVTNTNIISTGKGDVIGYMGTNRCYGGSNTGGDQGCQAFSYFLSQGDFEANDQFGATVGSTVDNGTTITINYTGVNAFELRRGELEYVIDTTKAVTTGTFTAVSGTPPAITFSGVNLATALNVTTPITYAAGKEAFCFSPTGNDATSGAKWVIPIRTITDSTHLTLAYNVQGSDTSWPSEGATSGNYRIYPCGQIVQGGLGTSAITVNKGTTSWTAGDAFEQPLGFDFMGSPGVIVWEQQLPIAPNVLNAGWTISNQSSKMFQSLGGLSLQGPWSTGINFNPYTSGNTTAPSYFVLTGVGAAPSQAMMYVRSNVNNENVNFLRVIRNGGSDATFSFNKSVDRWATPQDFNAVNFWLSGGTAFNSEITTAGTTAARTYTMPDNTGTLAELNLAQTWTANQTFGTVLFKNFQTATGSTPSCAVTGAGTGATCTVLAGSNSAGTLFITAGTTPGTSGTITLTYNGSLGTTSSFCNGLVLSNGSASWNARASIQDQTNSTSSTTWGWDNNAVALVNTSTYTVNYGCVGR